MHEVLGVEAALYLITIWHGQWACMYVRTGTIGDTPIRDITVHGHAQKVS